MNFGAKCCAKYPKPTKLETRTRSSKHQHQQNGFRGLEDGMSCEILVLSFQAMFFGKRSLISLDNQWSQTFLLELISRLQTWLCFQTSGAMLQVSVCVIMDARYSSIMGFPWS